MEPVKNQFVSFFILFSLLVITGCSIQKRHYNGGYYIQWHKRYHADEGKREKEKLEDTLVEVVDVDSTVAEVDTTLIPPIEIVPDADQKVKHEKLPPLPKEDRKFEPLGVLAFKILLLDLPVGFLLDHTGINDFKAESRIGLLFVVILLISFVLAVISMVRYLKNPKHYRFNIFAIIVILVAVFYFIEFLYGNLAFAIKFKYLF